VIPKKFSWRAALWWLAGALLTIGSSIFAFGVKSCGDILWGMYVVLFFTGFFYLKFPWALTVLAVAFLLGGMMYPRIARHRNLILVGWTILTVILALVTVANTPTPTDPCTAL
jgi:hypothetical protein